MQKITRMYLGNYGVQIAWYDGITFSLMDPATGLPTDTIINLENGGGKTTLLSFIFSCFETPIERFLTHLQNKNHRFSDYFSHDGLPGVVLIEWEMPGKSSGEAPYRLVIGQVVTIRASATGQSIIDRVYFSFVANDTLHFNAVPAPKLGPTPANTHTEFMRWFQEAGKLAPDFFHTRVQQDWHQHVRDERLIDIEMLQLQVNFSAQEGGFDTGFLNFNTEADFVCRFYDLILDPEQCASVRTSVVNICDKQNKRPIYEKRLAQLTTLQTSLSQFGILAKEYLAAQSAMSQAFETGSGLILSLESRQRELQDKLAAETVRRTLLEETAQNKEKEGASWANEAIVLADLQQTRLISAAEEAKALASASLMAAKEKLKHVRAAEAVTNINQAEALRDELATLAEQEKAQLLPWREKAEQSGALLRWALNAEEQAKRKEAAAEKAKEESATSQLKAFTKELGDIGLSEQGLQREQARLNAEEEAQKHAHIRLVRGGYLLDEETTAAGIVRWQAVETEQRVSVARLGNEIAELQAQEKVAQGTIKSESELRARLTTERAQGLQYLGEGEAQREALAQMPILRQAADAEVADPESPALPTALDRMMMSAEREISHSDVRLAELRAIRTSIEETGVAGSSRDVDWVVSALKSLGIRSAQPYNRYIAGALPDSDQARALVASNPSRFAGVCVAASEFEKARGITEIPLSLTSPVMVSTAALDAEPGRSDAIVLSAEDDARFNLEAAKVLLVSLEKQSTDEEARRAAQVRLRDDAWNGKQKVHAFLERYSAIKMQEARVKTEQQAFDIAAASERINQAEQTVAECQTQVEQHQKACQEALSAAKDAKRAADDIAQYQQTHEVGHAYRRARLQEIEGALKGHWERRAEIDAAKAELEDLKGKAIRQQLVLEAVADGLARERGQLKHVDKTFPAKETLVAQPESLVTLRDRHWTAVETLDTQEKLRLGLLQQRLEQAREAVTTKTLAFTKQFGGVVRSEVTPYMGLDFEQAIPAVERDIEAADAVLRGKENQLAVENSRLADFRLKHPPVFAPTETMLALDDEALTARIDLAEESHQACLKAVESSREEAQKARRLAMEAEQDSKLVQKHARTLTTQLQQNRVPTALPVELEEDVETQVLAAQEALAAGANVLTRTKEKARKACDALRLAAGNKDLVEVEPDIANILQRNEFEAACADSARLLEGIEDRIATTQANLDAMQADFETCVGELQGLANSAIVLLGSAVEKKKVPAAAPYVGGKAIMQMKGDLKHIPQEVRRQAVGIYIRSLIESKVVPARGTELVAAAVLAIHGKPLGLKILKMVPDAELQYVQVDKIQKSGGEGVAMAMFLYLLINQLRAETQPKLKKSGGPLILDNPFAKATNPVFWRALRMLSEAMDVQLIFATALPDYNTIGEFFHFNRLRKAGKNSKTSRWHLELADFDLNKHGAHA